MKREAEEEHGRAVRERQKLLERCAAAESRAAQAERALEGQVEEVEEVRGALQRRAALAEEEVLSVKTSSAAREERVRDELMEEVDGLRKLLAACEVRAVEADAQAKKAAVERDAAEAARKRMGEEMEEVQRRAGEATEGWRESERQMRKQITDSLAQVSVYERELGGLRALPMQVEAAGRDALRARSAAEQERKSLYGRIHELEQEVSAVRNKSNKLLKERDCKLALADKLKMEAEILRQQAGERLGLLANELVAVKQQVERLQEQVKGLEEKKLQLQRALNAAEGVASAQRLRVEELERDTRVAGERSRALSERHSAVEQSRESLADELNAVKVLHTDRCREVQDLRAGEQMREERLQHMQAQLERCGQELKKEEEARQRARCGMEEAIRERGEAEDVAAEARQVSAT